MKRETRSEATAPRRRRQGSLGALKQKLTLPAGVILSPEYEYRWVNDDGLRIVNLTQNDDWDFVTQNGSSTADAKSAHKHRVGKGEAGEPLFAYLLRKPKVYYDEDKALEQRAIDEKMKQIKLGSVDGDEALKRTNSYTAGISIREG